ncbi:MAG: riboflavin biosynthesis protein RibF [Candidatus Kapabacteria bacterium]|nr:riboflavin biosynthesis protein RibF [Candidatus Kapabacteria bacterium]
MYIHSNLDAVGFNPNTVLSIGTFDGVHRGHAVILNRLNEIASSLEYARSLIITFDPHPQIVLKNPDKPEIQLLTTIYERLNLFYKMKISDTAVVNFTKEFSNTNPEEFVKYLYEKVGIHTLLIGHDHAFGKDRAGNEELLTKLSEEYKFAIEKIPAFDMEGEKISSTKIRTALLSGDLNTALSMLGYEYSLLGNVVSGDGRGRTLGIPTANVVPLDENKLLPKNGVYFVSSEINGTRYYGMANIGVRPTFVETDKPILEVHFFDFNHYIYDYKISVTFHNFLREEQKFPTLDLFLSQLSEDRNICYELLDKRLSHAS